MKIQELRKTTRTNKKSAVKNEKDLIERAKTDREAFADLYNLHSRLVSNYVYRRTRDVHAMEDLVSNVFLIALRKLPRFRYRGVPFRFCLLRIATNEVNRWARRKGRQAPALLDESQVPAPPTDFLHSEEESEEARAHSALLSLPPKYQAVLSLYYLEDLTVREVAAILKCSEGTVKSRLARARSRLRVKLNRRSEYHE